MDQVTLKNLTSRVFDVRGLYTNKEEAKKALGNTVLNGDVIIINERYVEVDMNGNETEHYEIHCYVYIASTDELIRITESECSENN